MQFMAVMVAEGSVRGLLAQVAGVRKPLRAACSWVRAAHVVVFGGGGGCSQNYIMNKVMGEYTSVNDDGVNYLMRMWIIP